MYEYGHKGLPHALVHASELVQSGGHQAAYSTAVAETAHKGTIKAAAKFARTYASYNESQEGMLNYVLFDILWSAVIEHNKATKIRRQFLLRGCPQQTLTELPTECCTHCRTRTTGMV